MGGYSAKCYHCKKWFTSVQAFKDHLRDKHDLHGTHYLTDNEVYMTKEDKDERKADN